MKKARSTPKKLKMTTGDGQNALANTSPTNPAAWRVVNIDGCRCGCCGIIFDRSPIYQCENGHLSCVACYSSTSGNWCKCSPLNVTRSTVTESILAGLASPCKNANHGCTSVIPCLEHYDHEQVCVFKQYACFYDGTCRFSGSASAFPTHLRSQHEVQVLEPINLRKNEVLNLNFPVAVCIQPLVVNELVFMLHQGRQQGCSFFVMTMFGPPTREKEFIFEFSVSNAAGNKKISMRSFPSCHGLKKEPADFFIGSSFASEDGKSFKLALIIKS